MNDRTHIACFETIIYNIVGQRDDVQLMNHLIYRKARILPSVRRMKSQHDILFRRQWPTHAADAQFRAWVA
jgi:hypothetical protein